MITTLINELKNPTLSGICCGKTCIAGAVALSLVGYAIVGAPIVGSLIQKGSIKEAFELGLSAFTSSISSGTVGIWSLAVMECFERLSWKRKASIAGGLTAASYVSSPLWLQSPILSIPASEIYAANGIGLGLGAAALLIAEVSHCAIEKCKAVVNEYGRSSDGNNLDDSLLGDMV